MGEKEKKSVKDQKMGFGTNTDQEVIARVYTETKWKEMQGDTYLEGILVPLLLLLLSLLAHF